MLQDPSVMIIIIIHIYDIDIDDIIYGIYGPSYSKQDIFLIWKCFNNTSIDYYPLLIHCRK